MKIAMIFATFAVLTLSAGPVVAGDKAASGKNGYRLDELNVLKTCASSGDVATANRVLEYMFNFRWWHIKNLVSSLHPDYRHWHSSRVYAAVMTPEAGRPGLRFGNGQVNRQGYLKDLANVAFTNHVPGYIIAPSRIDCMGGETVVLTTTFSGTSVVRDAEGYVTKAAVIDNAPTRFTFTLKDGLIYRLIIDLPDAITLDVGRRLASSPTLSREEAAQRGFSATKFEDILADFTAQAE